MTGGDKACGTASARSWMESLQLTRKGGGGVKYFGEMPAASVVAPADRGHPTVTLRDTEYRAGVKIRARGSPVMSSASIVVVRQAGLKPAKRVAEVGGGGAAPDLPNMELFVFLFSSFRTPPGLKDRKDLDNYVDCDRKRGPRTTGCAGLVHPRRLPYASVKRAKSSDGGLPQNIRKIGGVYIVQTQLCHHLARNQDAAASAI